MYPFESLPPGFPNVPPAYYATFPPPAGTLVPGALTPVQLPDRAARVTADGSSASTAATGSIKARRSSTDAPVSKPAAVQRVDVDPGKSNPETSGASQVMKKYVLKINTRILSVSITLCVVFVGLERWLSQTMLLISRRRRTMGRTCTVYPFPLYIC